MWVVCAYYTPDVLYTNYAKELQKSLNSLSIPHDVVSIENQGDWFRSTQYKPTFLKQMLKKYFPDSVIYVDVDAIFCQYPIFFDTLDVNPNVNIAVHVLDHSQYKRKNHPPELLSGTVFLKNTVRTNQIIDQWIEECKKDPKLWDQRALATVLKNYKYYLLPKEYCMIFDYMVSVENPVIKHFQASRESRRNRAKEKSAHSRVITNRTLRRKTMQ